jgi:hypothetical protein
MLMAAPRDNAFEKFEADLKEAVTLMDSDTRMAVGLAVKAAWEFVDAHKQLAAQGLHRPFFALVAALSDLNEGRLATWLKPAQFGNRPPDSAMRQEAKAYACFCVDQLVKLGESVEKACKAVAEIWNKHGISFGGKLDTPPWRTIKDWRYKVSKLPAGNHQRDFIEALRKDAADNPSNYLGMDCIAKFDRILQEMGSKAALE